MKRLTILIFTLTMALSANYAQTTIPNGDFESWENTGTATEEPLHWNSNKTGGGLASFGPQTCFRDTSSLNGGSYCMKIMTGTAFGTVVNGGAATGKIEAPTNNKAQGYIHTIAGDTNFSSPFTGRPDSIAFWYRFSKQGSDYPTVETRLHLGNAYTPETPVSSNHPDSTVNIIGRAIWAGDSLDQITWRRVAVPVAYVDNRIPQYILITMTSSGDQSGGAAGSTLWVDGMTAIYGPSGLAESSSSSEVKVFCNSTGNVIADMTKSAIEGATFELMNINGQVLVNTTLRGGEVNAITADLAASIYVYRIINSQGVISGKLIKK